MTVRSDVIVVGAGLAGLTAAVELSDHGRSVTVLEACQRVGGRTETGHTADGQWIELGGQWIAPAHTELRRLIDRWGLATTPFGAPGNAASISNGRRCVIDPAATTDSALDTRDQADVDAAITRFGQLIDAVDLSAPWLTPEAKSLDQGTFASWIDEQLPTEAAREYFRTACELLFAPHPHEVSLLHAAVYFKSGEHLDGLREASRETQEERVIGGACAISDRLGAHLGDRVRLGAPVRSLAQTSDGVSVFTRTGERYDANRAIVTLPPALAGRLEYSPILPSARDQLTQRLHAISVVKMHLVYDTPFWLAEGLSGQGFVDTGPIKMVLDNTPPGYGHGMLVGFIEGADKIGWALNTPEQRRRALVDVAIELFGPSAGRPIEYIERDWTDQEFFRGCYGGHFAPGTWSAYGPALTAPVGRVHWAGTETSAYWTGYMEGAVRSGLRAAQEVLGEF